MRIGIDLDNTIVRYDGVFRSEALRRRLVPASVPAIKDAVRDSLRRAGREDAWTELQGHVYGPGMARASAFPGAKAFVARCRAAGVEVRLISHRTKTPFRGPAHDLHASARAWLSRSGAGFEPREIFLEESKAGKLARIASEGCTHFIDDLPEFLLDPAFPPGVERVLFDPSGTHEAPGLARAGSWAEIAGDLLSVREAAAKLLAKAGREGAFELRRLPGAANNRVFRVDAGGSTFALKSYFRHKNDGRDRLAAEFGFTRCAWGRKAPVPEPLAADAARGLALYGFIEGRRPEPGQVDADAVDQALRFFGALNSAEGRRTARKLPEASEACFSLAAHARLVGRRIELLSRCSDERAAAFARAELLPAHRRVAADAKSRSGERWNADLSQTERCVSPSDFGFHNALRGGDGRLRFLDFEYAGWDDPAKTVCDFFCQPAIPVPAALREAFAAGVAGWFSDPQAVRERVSVLLPLYKLKWCCILLNDFLAAGSARRRFADAAFDGERRRSEQLDKARRLFGELAQEPARR